MAENATAQPAHPLTLRRRRARPARLVGIPDGRRIDLFVDRTDVAFASHHWPTWGNEQIVEYRRLQRDLYSLLHDQTLRCSTRASTGIEIAENGSDAARAGEGLAHHGYYGSVSHNVKAVYQRYMGWFDGNPAGSGSTCRNRPARDTSQPWAVSTGWSSRPRGVRVR